MPTFTTPRKQTPFTDASNLSFANMKSAIFASVLGAAALVQASPQPLQKRALTPITVKGNGECLDTETIYGLCEKIVS